MDAAQIHDPGKTHVWLGTFETAEGAARAYGAKAKTNFQMAAELLNNCNNFVHINNNTCNPSQSSTLNSSSRLPFSPPLLLTSWRSQQRVLSLDYEGMSYKGLLDLDLTIALAVKIVCLSTLD
ncbi:ethylene-responsive transcription factor 4-like [Arachis stenosperma]|uniref:ethylene-responsive transcription factor 4-like n=1 Tax=Arachis stenosperma TaxID=217475 RepID=UPI0025AC4323|nr:ethylene-responsive transcription factor 4-like [Arachis stenosperma]